MKISVKTGDISSARADALLVGVHEGKGKLPAAAQAVDKAHGGGLKALLALGEFEGKAGQVAAAPGSPRIIACGLGAKGKLSATTVRDAFAAGARLAARAKCKSLALALPESAELDAAALVQALGEGLLLSAYDPSLHVTMDERKLPAPAKSAAILLPSGSSLSGAKKALARAEAFANGTNYARDLVNQPSNILTPKALANSAKAVAKMFPEISCTVWGPTEIQKRKMGGLVGVGQGSRQPYQFIQLRYAPKGKKPKKKLALVGKGLTFDTGGISIKPAAGMEQMKFDMGGAAAVIGCFRTLGELKPDVEVLGYVAAAENMPDGNAIKPGDVLHMMSGLTVEVNNTDAEGRLVLADALHYAKQQKPDFIVDAATLTGACFIALGDVACGLMSEDEVVTERVRKAGDAAGERAWRLPMEEVHRKKMHGHVADLKNTGPRDGGALTAGAFLSFFAKGTPWAHLDIAGTVWTEEDKPTNAKGATGFGARLFATLCEQYAQEKAKR